MTEDLRISMIQSHIIWEDREENLGYYGELLRRVSGRTDLAVLPETFTTGFSMDVEKQADTMEGQTVPTIKEWAKKYKLAVAGSFIAKDNGKFYNRAFFITPEGNSSFAMGVSRILATNPVTRVGSFSRTCCRKAGYCGKDIFSSCQGH